MADIGRSICVAMTGSLGATGLAYGDSGSIVPPCDKDEADCTARLQAAIDSAHDNLTGVVTLAPGEYRVTRLILRSKVRLVGAGRGATILRALPSKEPALIGMDAGPVIFSGLSHLRLTGGSGKTATNPKQWAVQLVAQPAPRGVAHGGLWWSSFDNIYVEDFDRGFGFLGGENDHLLPHQFNDFREVVTILNEGAEGPALLLSGQVAQFSFQQCQLDGSNGVSGTSIRIIKPLASKTNPDLHHFDMVTVQGVEQGVEIDGGQSIYFTSCWFENDKGGILVRSGSHAVTIANCRFANVGGKRAAVEFEANTTGAVTGNLFAGGKTEKSIRLADSAHVTDANNDLIWGAHE